MDLLSATEVTKYRFAVNDLEMRPRSWKLEASSSSHGPDVMVDDKTADQFTAGNMTETWFWNMEYRIRCCY